MSTRRLLVPGVTALLAIAAVAWATQARKESERLAVRRAVLDYCEAFYEVKPEYLRRSVHPNLNKFGFARRSPEDQYQKIPMSFDELIDLAGKWNKDGSKAKNAPKEVKVLDMLGQIASAKLTAAWGVDYLLLAKYDGKWKIEQVMWQIHPQESAGN